MSRSCVLGLILVAAVLSGTVQPAHGFFNKQCDTIAELAIANNFTILVQAMEAANLVDTFNSTDLMVTVFAPTDEAFVTALENLDLTAEELLGDTATLTSILQLHVVSTPLILNEWTELPTLREGQTLTIRPVVEAATTAAVMTPGLRACRFSFVYPIDTVLLPTMSPAPAQAPEMSAIAG